jgi:hypothetical protein
MAMVLCGTDMKGGAFGAWTSHNTCVGIGFQPVYRRSFEGADEETAEDAKGTEGLAGARDGDDAPTGYENVLSSATGGRDERPARPLSWQRTRGPRVPTFRRLVDRPDFARVWGKRKGAEDGSRGRSPSREEMR